MSSPNPTPLTYNGYVTQLATMAVVNTTTTNGVVVGVDAPFNALIPQALNYAELRIQRDVDLLPLQTSNNYQLAPANNQLQISANDFVTIQTLGVTVGGAISPLLPVTKEFLQNVYGSPGFLAQPQYFAMYGGDLATGGNTWTNIVVGPYPDINYPVVVTGTIRMPSLYQNATQAAAATGTTWISTNLPDLLIMASLVYVSMFQRNFEATSNDPQMPGSYENQYQALVGRAIVEEARKKFQASAWSSMSPPSVASPSR